MQQSVTGFMVSRGFLFFFRDEHRGPGYTHHDLVPGILEVYHLDNFPALAHCEQGSLVDHIGKIRSTHARGCPGQTGGVDLV